MQSLARERWASKVPAILKQAKVEAIHRARLATVIQESQDGNGKICNGEIMRTLSSPMCSLKLIFVFTNTTLSVFLPIK